MKSFVKTLLMNEMTVCTLLYNFATRPNIHKAIGRTWIQKGRMENQWDITWWNNECKPWRDCSSSFLGLDNNFQILWRNILFLSLVYCLRRESNDNHHNTSTLMHTLQWLWNSLSSYTFAMFAYYEYIYVYVGTRYYYYHIYNLNKCLTL